MGQSVNVGRRWRAHRSGLNNGIHPCKHLQRAWKKYGSDQFVFTLLEDVLSDQLDAREQAWMDLLKPEFNTAPQAGSNRGLKQSPDSIAKRSASNSGRRRTPEQCARIAAAKQGHGLGRKLSAEVRAKIGAAHLGRARPDITAARSGKPRPANVVAALKAANDCRYADRRARILAALSDFPNESAASIARRLGVNRDTVRKFKALVINSVEQSCRPVR